MNPAECLVPLPVKTVMRLGWTLRDGYVVCDVEYDPQIGPIVADGEDEFDAEDTGSATPSPEFHVLQVGKPYNPAVTAWTDRAAELVLRPGGIEFILFLASPKPSEIAAFKAGTAEFALLPGDRHLVWCYRFTNAKKSGNPAAQGPGIPWSDAPWEYHRQAAQLPVAVPGQYGTSTDIHLTLVDAATGIVKALRLVCPPATFADTLRAAVERQRQVPYDTAAAASDIQALYRPYPGTEQMVCQAEARFTAAR